MCFLKSIGPIFPDFLTIFQQIKPLIQLLFKHLKKMLRNTLRRFIKREEIKDKKACYIVVLNVKGALSGLREFSGNWKPFKNDEKCFLFYLKSSFRSQDISVFVINFWSCIKTP